VRIFLLFILCSVVLACSKKQTSPVPGYYTLYFATENGVIPARLDIDNVGGWHIINSEEAIQLDSVIMRNDSFFVKMPLFDSSLLGYWKNDSLFGHWIDHSRLNYSIPFMGKLTTSDSCSAHIEELNYQVTFSPTDTSAISYGYAVLQKRSNILTGTILTETGDYRYLEGEITDDSLWLSAFDGTHLFYLKGFLSGDSIINGVFLSGKHWKESWMASPSNSNTLRNPYSITTVRNGKNPGFQVLTSEGTPIQFDSTSWKNRVSIIQVMGSWCPNCTDESRFLRELYMSHKDQNLQVIPIAFERGDDITAACSRVQKQFNELQIPYSFYYGGKSNKEEAQKKLNFLSAVHSFPTSVFIDKNGVVRRVYTGYYGPGTHEEYQRHSEETKALIRELLAE
jgi:thiol-disulfide isomerase/thioredoxin